MHLCAPHVHTNIHISQITSSARTVESTSQVLEDFIQVRQADGGKVQITGVQCWKPSSITDRIVESFRLEKSSQLPSPTSDHPHPPTSLSGTSPWLSNTSRDGDLITSLGSLCHCITTLSEMFPNIQHESPLAQCEAILSLH